MKLIIVGGHLSPALAVIEALPKDAEVLFVGRKYTFEGDKSTSLEYNTIKDLKIPFASISTGRLQRKFTRYTIPSIFKIPYGFVQSFLILHKFKPDIVLSFGGYLSIPIGLSAFFLRIPIVIHEQTFEVGLSNRVLSIFAKKICISWETSRKFFSKEKTILTGNPIRTCHAEFISTSRETLKQVQGDKKKNMPIIYITGGSGGSHFINTLVEGCIKELLEKFIVIHQTGDAKEYGDFERLSLFKETLPVKFRARYYLTKFVDPREVGSILDIADLVVSRSGINTITELIFFEKPSLLIPLPYSQNNEQVKNALFLKEKGLGEICYQGKNDRSEFIKTLNTMFDNLDKYRAKYKLSELINKDAAKKIIDVVYYEAEHKK